MTEAAKHWIGGEWIASGELKNSINPATYEIIGQYHDGGKEQAEQAIQAAKADHVRQDGGEL